MTVDADADFIQMIEHKRCQVPWLSSDDFNYQNRYFFCSVYVVLCSLIILLWPYHTAL